MQVESGDSSSEPYKYQIARVNNFFPTSFQHTQFLTKNQNVSVKSDIIRHKGPYSFCYVLVEKHTGFGAHLQ